MNTVNELLVQLAGDDPIQAFHARRKLQKMIDAATDPRETKQLSGLADELLAELLAVADSATVKPRQSNVPEDLSTDFTPKHGIRVRRTICQLLAPITTDAQVPALTKCLADLEIRELVCGALGQIPTTPATVALVKAANRVGPEFRVSVLNSLGTERWREAMVTLVRFAGDADPDVRLAALEGLANFPESENDKLFVAAAQMASPRHRDRAWKARVRFAETLRRSGDAESAAAVYRAIETAMPAGSWTNAARLALSSMSSQNL